jgi:hypothetical protein
MRTLEFNKPGASAQSDESRPAIRFKRTISLVIPFSEVVCESYSYAQASGEIIHKRSLLGKSLPYVRVQGLSYVNLALRAENLSRTDIDGFVTDIKTGGVQIFSTATLRASVAKDRTLNVVGQNYSYVQVNGTIIP